MNVSDHGEIDLLRGPYQTLVRLYGGRDDIIAEQQKDGFYLDAMSEGLTFERFVEHVQLKKTYAIYNMDDSKRVKFGLFDLDVVDRNQGWGAIRPGIEEKRKESFRILDALLETGLKRKNILLEFPTVGFHIVIFFKEPVPAKGLKSWMGRLLDAIGLRPIPFYPRKTEDSVYGDRIQLPFRINRNTGRRCNFIRDIETFHPDRYNERPDFGALDRIVPIGPEWSGHAVF